MIHVTPKSRLDEVLRETSASHLICLLTEANDGACPASISRQNYLLLTMNDITEPRPGLTMPTSEHISDLLDFVRRWSRAGPLVISCYAGISRSTAAAYVVAATLMPDRDEAELANELRRLSPMATPNIRIVELADSMLSRSGRMVSAIRAIGRGAEAYEGTPFELVVD